MLKSNKMLAQSCFHIRAHAHYLVLTVTCLTFFSFVMTFAPEKPFLSSDSPSFIDFASDRTAGYPILLSLIRIFDDQLHALSPIQLFMFCSASLLFSMGMGSLTRSIWCAVAVLALMFGNYEVVKYSFWVLSDGPFISFVTASLGTFALWLATKRPIWLVTASMCSAAAISIRPAGGTLLLMLPVFFLYSWYALRRPGQTLALMVLSVGFVFFLSLIAYHQSHG